MENSTITDKAKVGMNTDTSKQAEKINPNVPKAFIDFLLSIGMQIEDWSDETTQTLAIGNHWYCVVFEERKFRGVEYMDEPNDFRADLFNFHLPNTLDQFVMILACAGIYKLPLSYRNDQDVINGINQYVAMKIEVAESMLQGSDNAPHFNEIKRGLYQLTDVRNEISRLNGGK